MEEQVKIAIEARVRSTRPLPGKNESWSKLASVDDLVKKLEIAIPSGTIPGGITELPSGTIDAPAGLVLLRDETSFIELCAASQPGGKNLQFEVLRHEDDCVDARKSGKLVFEDMGDNRARFSLGACGTFYVIAFVSWEKGARTGAEPAAVFPLVIVDARVEVLDAIQHAKSARWCIIGYDRKEYADRCEDSSVLAFMSGGREVQEAPIQLSAKVRLIGGGKDGRVGTDKVGGGWVSNVVRQERRAMYSGGWSCERLRVCDKADVSRGSLGFGLELNSKDRERAALVELPLLDTSRGKNSHDKAPDLTAKALGGRDGPTLSTSQFQVHGGVLLTRAHDIPSERIALQDGERGVLVAATYLLDFRNGLVLWTSDAPQDYRALALVSWGIEAEAKMGEVKENDEDLFARIGDRRVQLPEPRKQLLEAPCDPAVVGLQMRPPTLQSVMILSWEAS